MKRSIIKTVTMSHRRTAMSVLMLSTIAVPGLLQADCLPSAPTNYTVPFSLVTLKNFSSGGNQYASWVQSSLTITNTKTLFFSSITLASSGNQQLFSDRTTNCGEFSCQPFDINQPDQLGVSISRSYSLNSSTNGVIYVTLTLQSWGNAKETFTGTCDATSGELYYTSNTGMGVITFGTPQPPQVTQ